MRIHTDNTAWTLHTVIATVVINCYILFMHVHAAIVCKVIVSYFHMDHFLILGPNGSGKSTIIKQLKILRGDGFNEK